jgi:hypothetical protein
VALSDRLALLITADVDQAVRGFKQVGKAAEKELGGAEKRMDKLGNTMTTAGAGMVAFGAVALVGLGKAAQASEEANLAQVKLQNTINNMPKLAGENISSFNELATAIQSKTAADADQIVSAQAMLGTFNLTGDEIRDITPLVVDFARKFGVDMTSAATQVGKALDGNVGALKRNDVSIDEVRFKTDRYGAVQDALAKQVGGFAEAEGKTFAGSLERMKNQLGDLAEGVGGGAVDAFTNMFGAVGKASGALNKFSPSAQKTAGTIATYGATALVAVGATSTLIGQIILARERFGQAGSAIKNFAGGLDKGKLAVRGLQAGIAAVGLTVLANQLQQARKEANKFAEAVGAGLGDSPVKQAEAYRRAIADLQDQAGEGISFRAAGVKIFSDDNAKDANNKIDALNENLRGLELQIAETGTRAEVMGLTTFSAAEKADIAMRRFGASATAVEAAITPAGEAARKAGESQAGLAKATGDVGTKAGEAVPSTTSFATSLDVLGYNSRAVEDALSELNDAVDKYLGKTFSVQEATDNLQGTFNGFKEVVKAVKGDYDGTSDAALAYRDAGQEIVTGAAGVIQALAETGASSDEVKAKQEQLATQAYLTAIAAGVERAEAQKLADSIRGIPTKWNSTITADTSQAQAELDRLTSAFGRATSAAHGLSGTHLAAVVQANARAEGGPVKKGTPYIVGEKRAELFVPDQNGTILPKVPQGEAGVTHTGTAITNNWYITGQNAEDIGVQVERILRREAAFAGATADSS